MAVTLKRDLTARRNAPLAWEWAGIVDDDDAPVDFTTATDVRMQVRLHGAAAGAALITLLPVEDELTEGLILEVGSIRGFIDEASLAVLPAGVAGRAVRFRADVLVDLDGLGPVVWIEGFLTVRAGVTDRLGIRITEAGRIRITETGSIRVTE